MTVSRPSPFERESAELLYDHLIDLHGRVFSTEQFEAAYHLLASALHVAEELDDLERLDSIRRLAESRQIDVDGAEPQHLMSSVSASGRRNVARFTALALTAKAASGRINADRAATRSREARG